MGKKINPAEPKTFMRFDENLKRRLAKAAKDDRRAMADEVAVLLEEAFALREQSAKSTPVHSDSKK
jgi:hypothetical protein